MQRVEWYFWGSAGSSCGSSRTQRYASLDEAEEAYRLFDTQTTGKGVFLL